MFGFEIHCSVLLVEDYRIERRVRGGYMNRWLIREVEQGTRPKRGMYRHGNMIYMHPEVLKELNKQLAAKGQAPVRETKNQATDWVRSVIESAF